METALISASIGYAISVLLETFPKLKELWAAFGYKQVALLVVFLAAPFAIYGLSCAGLDFTKEVVCPPDAFASAKFYFDALKVGALAFVGSQIGWGTVSRGLSEDHR